MKQGTYFYYASRFFFIPINAGKALTCAKIWRRAEASILSHCFFNWGRRYARQQQKTGHIL
ncbi:TPA: hypothetical protein MEY91_003694 [Klebsiella pneumoniae]|nr:hypothetical protein [Klebsiella pneumoniae]HBW8475001.1 hypothetical protein [Klebsiella pneumoniae]